MPSPPSNALRAGRPRSGPAAAAALGFPWLADFAGTAFASLRLSRGLLLVGASYAGSFLLSKRPRRYRQSTNCLSSFFGRENDNDQLRFRSGSTRFETLRTAFEIVKERNLQALP